MVKSATKSEITQDAGRQAVEYGRLRNDLKGMLDQQYRVGDRVPSERRLAAEFQVSPATISRALQELAQAGIVRRVRGSGTYLCDVAASSAPGAVLLLEKDSAGYDALRPSLAGRTIGIIGGIGETPSRPGEPERVGHRISSAVEREIQTFGGRTRVVDAQRRPEGSEQGLIAGMLRAGVDSLILIDYSLSITRWLPPMLEASRHSPERIPLALVLTSGACEWPVSCVRIDDLWGVFEATSHLLSKGHRRLAFISPPPGFYSWADARAGAFSRALHAWNSSEGKPASGTVICGPKECCSPDSGCQWTQIGQALAAEFMEWGDLTGIVAANDNIALHFIAALNAKGIQVPRDVSVVGYDNTVEAASAELCTLDLPAEQLGIQAARLCCQSRSNPAGDTRMEIALKPILLERSSVRTLELVP